MRRLTSVLAVTCVVALLATGCTADGDDGVSARERLTAAQSTLANTDAVTLELTSSDTPSNTDGVQSAKGTAVMQGTPIKFAGELQGRIGGLTATVGILVIGDDAYMKLFTPDYEPVDLAGISAPNPTNFFAPDTGIASLMAATTDVARGDQVREGTEVLTEITGSLSGDRVLALLHLGAADRTFAVNYALTDDNELRRVTLRGEFWTGTESEYSMLLTDYGKVIVIEAPTPRS